MSDSMKPHKPKLIFAIVATLYFLWVASNPMMDGIGNFLNLVDLPIHETGHLLFSPFGQFIMVAGGSLFQVIVPAIFVGYFLWNEAPYSAAIVLFWVGQSILNVYVYAADSIVGRLVLTSGATLSEGSFHDWNFMLTELGLLSYTDSIAGLIRLVGTLTILAAGALSIYLSFGEQAEIGFPE
ncbi:MAG: hypothetical protein HKN25_05605 [Pyrinomonadaceae bacterium]|nr:hypothetical protein [Pyrinomonadaceae bacterium]